MVTKKIVVIGGGTGMSQVLLGLKNGGYNLKAILSMTDDGGSSGRIRKEFNILPPGDVRKALVALAQTKNTSLIKLFRYRFNKGRGLEGHSLGNLFLTALADIKKSFSQSITEASFILEVEGEIVPATFEKTTLWAKLKNGNTIKGETNIDIPKEKHRAPITKVWLEPPVSANRKAIEAIDYADMIILGPGDLYTSIIPNFLVKGIGEAIKKSLGKKVYVCNIMTKQGETDEFRAIDFLKTIEMYLGNDILDYFIVNSNIPKKRQAVGYNQKDFKGVKRPLLIQKDLLSSKSLLHDPKKIADIVQSLL